MKTLENLDLSSYGVEEMSSSEINETDGGCLFAFIIVGLAIASFLINGGIWINDYHASM